MLNAATTAATANLYNGGNREEIVALLAKALAPTEVAALRVVETGKVGYYMHSSKKVARGITVGKLQKLIDNRLIASASYSWGNHTMELTRFGAQVLAAKTLPASAK